MYVPDWMNVNLRQTGVGPCDLHGSLAWGVCTVDGKMRVQI